LFLEVDPSGARRWLLRTIVKGRRDLGFGSASLVSLADAQNGKSRASRPAEGCVASS